MFILIGALWIFVGALTVPLHDRNIGSPAIFITERVDAAFFGRRPTELLTSDPALAKFRTMMLTVISGCLLLAGIMFILVAWFGLRARETWALVALAAGGALAVAWWGWALLPYFRAGVPMTFRDAPPFIKVPGILIVPATVLGWMGLR